MICDKCGKSNISGLTECSHCGAEMPKTSDCSGFADILSYKPQSGNYVMTGEEIVAERIREEEMQKLIRKSDNIMRFTQKNAKFGVIAVGLSVIILICSIVFGIATLNSVKKYKVGTEEKIDELIEKLEGDTRDNEGGEDFVTTPDEDEEKETKTPKSTNTPNPTTRPETTKSAAPSQTPKATATASVKPSAKPSETPSAKPTQIPSEAPQESEQDTEADEDNKGSN